MRQLGAQDGGLKRIEPTIITHDLVEIRATTPVGAQLHECLEQRLILRDHHAAVAVSAEILRGEETIRPDRRGFTGHHLHAVDQAARSDGLGGILDDRTSLRGLIDLLDCGHLTEQIDGNHGFGLLADTRTNRIGVDVEGARIDVDEDGARPDIVHRAGRGKERERRGHDLVACPNVERTQRE